MRAALLSSALAACTALSDFSVTQCQVDSDCATIPDGVWQCKRDVCQLGCTSNQHCADTDPRYPICSEPGGECVALTLPSGECYASAGFDEQAASSLTARDMIFVGAFAPTLRSPTWLTLELARSELEAAGGLRTPRGVAPLVLLLCDDSPAKIDVAIDHLADLGAAAVVASLPEDVLQNALYRPAVRDRVLFLSPHGGSAVAASPGDAEPLLFHWGSAPGRALPLYRTLIDRASQRAIDAGVAADAYRIAVLVSDAAEDVAFADAVSAQVEVAGVGAQELARNGQLRPFRLSNTGESPVEDLVRYAPALILSFVGGTNPTSPFGERSAVLEALEATGASAQWVPPLYVLGPRNLEDAAPARLAAADSSFAARVVLVSAERVPEPQEERLLDQRFDAAFPLLGPRLRSRASPSVYDSGYLLFHALQASSEGGAVSASALLDGIARVTRSAGVAVPAGPEGLPVAAALMGEGLDVNLSSTSGLASFDPEQQARSGTPDVYCWLPSGQRERAATLAADTLQRLSTEDDCAPWLAPD